MPLELHCGYTAVIQVWYADNSETTYWSMQATKVAGKSFGSTSLRPSFIELQDAANAPTSSSVSEDPESQVVTLCSAGIRWFYWALTKSSDNLMSDGSIKGGTPSSHHGFFTEGRGIKGEEGQASLPETWCCYNHEWHQSANLIKETVLLCNAWFGV